jgi:hypothetical protein
MVYLKWDIVVSMFRITIIRFHLTYMIQIVTFVLSPIIIVILCLFERGHIVVNINITYPITWFVEGYIYGLNGGIYLVSNTINRFHRLVNHI